MHTCIPWPDGRTTNVAVFPRALPFFVLTSVSALVIGSRQRELSPHEPWFVRRVRQLMRKLVRLNSSERRRRVVGRAPFTHIASTVPSESGVTRYLLETMG